MHGARWTTRLTRATLCCSASVAQTTLLKDLLTKSKGMRVAVVENEYGMDIDSSLVAATEVIMELCTAAARVLLPTTAALACRPSSPTSRQQLASSNRLPSRANPLETAQHSGTSI